MSAKMTITALAALFLLAGCATRAETKKMTSLDRATDSIVDQSKAYLHRQEVLRERLQKIKPAPALEPVVPTYDALADVKVTLDVDNADIQFVLQADRKSTRLNSSHTDISRMPSSA